MIDAELFRREIETAYRTSGNLLGWRFLYSHQSVLQKADVAIIGLNPGGTGEVVEHGDFAMSKKGESAYVHEQWKGYPAGQEPYQQQVQLICGRLGVVPGDVLAGNLILWRSRSEAELKQKHDAIQFGRKVWGTVLCQCQPSTIVAVGLPTGKEVAKLVGINVFDEHAIGWGQQRALSGTNGHQKLVVFPHLSRFRVMGREKSRAEIDQIFTLLR